MSSRSSNYTAANGPARVSTMTNSNSGGGARPQRAYNTRSSTVSVTQLLSDSCSSLINRIANRVRGPSVHAIDGRSRSRRSKGPSSSLAAAGVVRSADKSTTKTGAPSADEFETGRTTAALPKREYRYGDPTSRHQTERLLERKHWTQQQQPQHHHRDKDDSLKRSSSNVMLVDTKRWLSIPGSEYVSSSRERLHRDANARSGAGRSHGASRREYGTSSKDVADCAPSTAAAHKLSIYDADAGASARNSRVGGSHSFRLATARRRQPDDRYDELLGRCSYAYKERPLAKSATSIVLSEKAYPFVATAAACQRRAAKLRDRTPYRGGEEQAPQPTAAPDRQLRSYDYRHKSAGGAGGRRETLLYSFRPLKGCADCGGSGRDSTLSVSRTRLDTSASTHDLTRSRRDSPHVSRTRGSTTSRRDVSASRRDVLSSCRGVYLSRLTIGRDYEEGGGAARGSVAAAEPTAISGRKAVEAPPAQESAVASAPVTKSKKSPVRLVDNGASVDGVSSKAPVVAQSTLKPPGVVSADENGATGRVSSSTSDREVKRKEIQALIEKYAGLVEQSANEVPNVLTKYQKKYSALLASSTTSESQDVTAEAVSVLILSFASFDCTLFYMD